MVVLFLGRLVDDFGSIYLESPARQFLSNASREGLWQVCKALRIIYPELTPMGNLCIGERLRWISMEEVDAVQRAA